MCPNRISEQYRVAVNEKDDAILSIYLLLIKCCRMIIICSRIEI